MKKKVTALLLALILLLSVGSAACAAETDTVPTSVEDIAGELSALAGDAALPIAASGAFADVADDAYYFDAVDWAVESGITEGMGDGLFAPDATCTRAQVVTFLWRLDGETLPTSGENSFTDVAAGSWYADAVLWAVEQKVTDGMGDGIFLPDGTCTRAQIVTFLWKYAGKPAADSAENPFTDVNGDDWYAEAVAWAVDRGITTGLTESTFGPEEPCTRAQIVTFLYRYANAEEETPPVTEPVETEPVETEPAVTEPAETEPAVTEPTVTEPVVTEPTETEPSATEPMPSEPDWGMGGEDF